MKISVVTISYNQDKFLEQCILSVKNQTYKNFEHIIVDAGSSDRSRKIIHKYKKSNGRYMYNVHQMYIEMYSPKYALLKCTMLCTTNHVHWLLHQMYI